MIQREQVGACTPRAALSAQLREESMHSLGPFGCGQCCRKHWDITPEGWELSLVWLPQLILPVLTVIVEKHFVQISFEKSKSTWGSQVCS